MNNPWRSRGCDVTLPFTALKELNMSVVSVTLSNNISPFQGLIRVVIIDPQLALGVIQIMPLRGKENHYLDVSCYNQIYIYLLIY